MIDDNYFLGMSFYLSFMLSSSRFLKSICRILGVEKKTYRPRVLAPQLGTDKRDCRFLASPQRHKLAITFVTPWCLCIKVPY